MKNKNRYFHEAEVLNFSSFEGSVFIKLSNIDLEEILELVRTENFVINNIKDMKKDKILQNLSLEFKSVKKLESDAEIHGTDLMFSQDGEVLDITFVDHVAQILLLWHVYSPHQTITKFYDVSFEKVVIDLL